MLKLRDKPMRLLLALVAAALFLVIGMLVYELVLDESGLRHYDLGGQAFEIYDYETASRHLDKYLSFHPQDTAARLLAAQTSRRLDDLEEAERHLKLAEKYGGAAREFETERQLATIQAGDLRDIDRWRRFCEEQPDGPAFVNAILAILEGSYRTRNLVVVEWAVELWLKRRTGKIDRAQGLIFRGRARLPAEDSSQAMEDFRRAVELAPDYHGARTWLVSALLLYEPKEAPPHLDWLRRHRPKDRLVKFLTARYHRSVGEPELAAILLDEALAAMPDGLNKVPMIIERAKIAMDLDRLQEAERWLNEAKSLAPSHRDVNATFAACLVRQPSRLEEARRYQEKIRELDAAMVDSGHK
ncbi:MAG: hypothetical protein EXR98_04370 [Gemmataceae bacterium]|nr:hypothetical protein [Gemmataceae bacterium]